MFHHLSSRSDVLCAMKPREVLTVLRGLLSAGLLLVIIIYELLNILEFYFLPRPIY